MYRLKISDLSFCELATEESEVKGGFNIALSSNKQLNLDSLLTKALSITSTPSPQEYSPKEVYSDSDFIVSKLDNQATGDSGYQVSSKDGKSRTTVIVSPKSLRSTGISIATSYSS